MSLTKAELWQRFQRRRLELPAIQLALDTSRVDCPDDYFDAQQEPLKRMFEEMDALEAGAIANPDENRQVGHYWLRDADRAPKAELRRAIREALAAIHRFAHEVHTGVVTGARGPFKNLLVIGIGGSALGPQFVDNALGNPVADRLELFFFDNTDPDGMDRAMARLATELGRTLCIVISKSGDTKETRNGMLEAAAAYARAGLSFPDHAVAITMAGSRLDQQAIDQRWLRRFPMWDWVGGRTSQTSAVGLLPAALQGIDIEALLAGARACDAETRRHDVRTNPAAQLALMWFFLGRGRGEKDMVIIPYKDRLELFSRYLQQLVMESLGKEKDRAGRVVHQGLAVYGNKGSTDQHAYIQQLRDGLPNFFVVFLEVLRDRLGPSVEVEPGCTSGDFLSGFLQGTRTALYESGRPSVTLTISEVSPFTVGVLIALFERAVGFYASLIDINAYHQPGVQAGKLAATDVLKLQRRVVDYYAGRSGRPATIEQAASDLGIPDEAETLFHICQHLAANPGRGIVRIRPGSPAEATYAAG